MVAPADWKEIKVGDYAHITTGKKNTQDRIADGKYPFFVRSQNVERINSYSYDGEAVLTAGDGVGTGKVFHYINGKFDCHQRVYRITDFRSDLNGKFFYLLFSRLFYDRIMSMTAKSSVDSVRMEMISEMELVVPSSIREQELIAEALSDADAAIESLDSLIAKKRDVKQAAMQQLLTGRTRLPGFTADWKEVRLGEICELSLAASKKSRSDGRGKYIIADMGSVSKDGSFLTHKTTDVREDVLRTGDLVMPKDDIGGGQIIGKAVLVDEDERYVLGDHVYRLRLSDGCPAFVRYGINSYKVNIQLRSKVVGSAQLGLGRRAVLEQPISFPLLKEQEAVAEALTLMDDELEALTEQVSKLRMVKEGMMQDLLTGKVRLV